MLVASLMCWFENDGLLPLENFMFDFPMRFYLCSMTEEICEQLLASVAGELDHYIDDYSEKFIDKI